MEEGEEEGRKEGRKDEREGGEGRRNRRLQEGGKVQTGSSETEAK